MLIQVGSQTISSTAIVPLLKRYQLLPQLQREIIIDSAIASITCTKEETAPAFEQLAQAHHLEPSNAHRVLCDRFDLTVEELETWATRSLRLEKFKQNTWGHMLENYFLKRKRQLDQVIYSLIRTKDAGIAQEIYFRLQENEQTFTELALLYSQGQEVKTRGIVGPMPLSASHPHIATMLAVSQPGQLWLPQKINDWFVIIRMEEYIHARLDEAMRQQLLEELFNNWLSAQLQQSGRV